MIKRNLNNVLSFEILDVACGTGVVGKELREAGYNNIDGLDPSEGYLQEVVAQGTFRKVFRAFIDPEKPTEIPADTYDALLCCAGFFQVILFSPYRGTGCHIYIFHM